jgi:hypothetical protein
METVQEKTTEEIMAAIGKLNESVASCDQSIIKAEGLVDQGPSIIGITFCSSKGSTHFSFLSTDTVRAVATVIKSEFEKHREKFIQEASELMKS